MKRKILILTSLLVSLSVGAQNGLWNFPIKPGTIEWRLLKNHQEKLDVCQIPDEVLTNISTPELLSLCMDYPLLEDAFFYNNLDEGIEKNLLKFNGFKELLERKDGWYYLLNYLSEKESICERIGVYTLVDLGKEICKLTIAERLLTNDIIVNNISHSDKLKVALQACRNFKLKRAYGDTMGQNAIANAAYLLCVYFNELSDKVYQSVALSNFLRTGHLDYEGKIINELIILSSIILN